MKFMLLVSYWRICFHRHRSHPQQDTLVAWWLTGFRLQAIWVRHSMFYSMRISKSLKTFRYYSSIAVCLRRMSTWKRS
jgi:hypothetical protein